jgi:choline dehydrogenase-like flavoprotein
VDDERRTVDYVVIGAGFGGSITACRLAQAGHAVCVLERGRRWPRTGFPRTPANVRPPISYYRQMVLTQVLPGRREKLDAIYDNPITAPTTLVWGLKDGALSTKVAMHSYKDAGCPVEWRPLPGVGHFVDLEAPGELANEIARVVGLGPSPQPATELTRQ